MSGAKGQGTSSKLLADRVGYAIWPLNHPIALCFGSGCCAVPSAEVKFQYQSSWLLYVEWGGVSISAFAFWAVLVWKLPLYELSQEDPGTEGGFR